MKAIYYTEYGSPDVLTYGDQPTPTIDANQVLVKVAATSFNPADAMIRLGVMQTMLPIKFPYIPGFDVAGTVAAVGSKVTTFKPGDRVIGLLDMVKSGATAEYVAISTANLVPFPATLSLADGAALPGAGLSAWQGVFALGQLQAGQRVLITGAAGGVGTFAVQFAKWRGATVIGTASSANASVLQALGLDQLIDYHTQTVAAALTDPVDLILNLAPLSDEDVTALLKQLKPGGRLVSTLNPADETVAKRLGVSAHQMAVAMVSADLAKIVDLVTHNQVHAEITQRVSFTDLAQVHEQVGHTHGKVVIEVAP